MRLLPFLLLAACVQDVSVTKRDVDNDGDGYTVEVDCDDGRAVVHPDAPEACDGLDNDCDEAVDEDATDATAWYADADGDGHGDPDAVTMACEAAPGAVADGDDCDDADATTFPGADELCDGVDDDCDTTVDEDAIDVGTWHADADGDGYGDPATAVSACAGGPDEVSDGTDCDDTAAAVHPTAPEDDCADPVDYNCDGSVGYADADGDGLAACDDCDDADPAVHPGAAEVCDAADTDEDCDGLADDADADVTGTTAWGRDADGDGYAGAGATVASCEAPVGYVSVFGDCDDLDGGLHPGGAEVCDAADADEDCDGLVDDADPSTDAATWTTHYGDSDGDGFGDPARSATLCDTPAGYVSNDDDCNDGSASISPADTEVCDASNTDEDCDGLADDADTTASGRSTYYRDADADAYGSATVTTTVCDLPAGYVTNDDDCNDGSASISPADTEVCDDGVDQDCDGADDSCPGGGYAGDYAVNSGYDTKIYGSAAEDGVGSAVVAGDFDGDGVGDLVVGASGMTLAGYDGAVLGYYGPVRSGAWASTSYDDFAYSNPTSASANRLGGALWNVGDIDLDGDDDLAAYSALYTVTILRGGDTGTTTVTAASDGTFTCNQATRGGNVDGAGADDDWLCANQTYASNAGAVYAYSGTSTSAYATLVGESAGDYLGWSLSGGGDIDGDGYGDFVVGAVYNDSAAGNAGAAYVVYGPVSGTANIATADHKLVGVSASDYLGAVVKITGDTNADGYDDFLVSAVDNDTGGASAGAAWLVTTPGSGTITSFAAATYYGDEPGDSMTETDVDAADLDGDGRIDLVLSAYLSSASASAAGAAYLVYGPHGGTLDLGAADARWLGTNANDAMGADLTAIPDMDGDGDAELALAGFWHDYATTSASVTNRGAVWIWPGE